MQWAVVLTWLFVPKLEAILMLIYLFVKDVFSYDEDDMVEDPYLAQHLAHFGINITQMEKVLQAFCMMMINA